MCRGCREAPQRAICSGWFPCYADDLLACVPGEGFLFNLLSQLCACVCVFICVCVCVQGCYKPVLPLSIIVLILRHLGHLAVGGGYEEERSVLVNDGSKTLIQNVHVVVKVYFKLLFCNAAVIVLFS